MGVVLGVPFCCDKSPVNYVQAIFCPARQKMENWGEEKMAGGGGLSLSGLARFGSVLVGSSFKISIWCRRDVSFSKQVAFAVGETILDVSNVHLV